jgi:ectoine hydroxylase-related dioxygenase (phytanoyl-CoA dioxygenase family)
MNTLSIDESSFLESGYSVLPEAFDISQIRHEVYELIDTDLAAGTIKTSDASLRPKDVLSCNSVKEFISGQKCRDIIRPLFSSDPVLCSLGANCVLPGGLGMGLHRDYPYLSKKKQNYSGTLLCAQIILVLDGMDEHNGATNVFPSSHLGKLVKPVRVFCPPGSLIVMHGALMHSVEKNSSGKPRTNLLASFSPYWVRPFSDLISMRSDEELSSELWRTLLGLNFAQRVSSEIPTAKHGQN